MLLKPDMPVERFGERRGRVLWWSAITGMGRILTNQGVVGVHWTNVAPIGRRAYLVYNELVSFEDLRAPHDSGRVKNYALEAVGVVRIAA